MTPMLLVLALDACALANHACRARDYEARAHEAGADHTTTVERLYLAHLEHLLDFDDRGEQGLGARRGSSQLHAAAGTCRASRSTCPSRQPRPARRSVRSRRRVHLYDRELSGDLVDLRQEFAQPLAERLELGERHQGPAPLAALASARRLAPPLQVGPTRVARLRTPP